AVVGGDGVVAQFAAAAVGERRRDAVDTHGAERRGGAAVRGGDRIVVLDAGDGAGEGRVRLAIGPAGGVGRHCQRRPRDRQRAIDERNRVVRGGQAARGDGIAAHRTGGRGQRAETQGAAQGSGRVPVDEAAVTGGEGGVSLAV